MLIPDIKSSLRRNQHIILNGIFPVLDVSPSYFSPLAPQSVSHLHLLPSELCSIKSSPYFILKSLPTGCIITVYKYVLHPHPKASSLDSALPCEPWELVSTLWLFNQLLTFTKSNLFLLHFSYFSFIPHSPDLVQALAELAKFGQLRTS